VRLPQLNIWLSLGVVVAVVGQVVEAVARGAIEQLLDLLFLLECRLPLPLVVVAMVMLVKVAERLVATLYFLQSHQQAVVMEVGQLLGAMVALVVAQTLVKQGAHKRAVQLHLDRVITAVQQNLLLIELVVVAELALRVVTVVEQPPEMAV
jgi:hypothetical protein